MTTRPPEHVRGARRRPGAPASTGAVLSDEVTAGDRGRA